MSCGWEGNRRSGVALAMRHRHQWSIHLRAHGLRKGDEFTAHTRRGVWHSFTFLSCAAVYKFSNNEPSVTSLFQWLGHTSGVRSVQENTYFFGGGVCDFSVLQAYA